ncbi:phage major capsid protein [Bradyrhizobium sp. AUGA SZCCT0182]|uniref:phage major capsid protein n=1 Tax=Bradyrhizobium sp. AUGA SZCCT0182 TaxID=2807667 RepID=UPI001BA82452|nr:phage major capsid protein [Bradyrhizobium sp. AUGA SZCCT0182]MBR1231976.1 phage major capsid protein [Bradyrhizobium sp. AUGA SZCCT0182]
MHQNPIETAGRAVIAGKALAFSQFVACTAISDGRRKEALQTFEHRYPRSLHLDVIRKTAIAPASTADGTWAGPLAPINSLAAAFVEYLRPLTVIGQMQGFRKMPFNTRAPRTTAGTSVGWSGAGSPMLVSAMSFETMTFESSKIGGIVVFTDELARSAEPDAPELIRQDLAGAVAEFSDVAFLDPTIAEVVGVSPASITYGAPTVASTGTTADAFAADFRALCALIETNMIAPYLVMKATTAIALAAMNVQLTRNVGAKGGNIAGIPVIISASTPTDSNSPSDGTIILIDAAEVFMNEGGLEFDASKNAIVQMSNAPDSPVTAATQMQSLWQNNLIGVLVRRYIRWERRRENSVAVLTGVGY